METVKWSRIKLRDQSVWVVCSWEKPSATLDTYFNNLLRLIPFEIRVVPRIHVLSKLWGERVSGELEDLGMELIRDPSIGAKFLGTEKAPPTYVGTEARAQAQREDRRRRAEEDWRSANGYANRAQAETPTQRAAREEAERMERIRKMYRAALGHDDDPFAGFYERQSNAYANPFSGVNREPPRQRAAPPPIRPGKGPTAEDWRALFLIPGAPAEVVRASHRALAILFHPDRGAGNEAKLVAVNVARDKILASLGAEKVS